MAMKLHVQSGVSTLFIATLVGLLASAVGCSQRQEANESAPAATPADAAPAPEQAPVANDAAPVAAAQAGKADGESCLASSDCASGLCEGQGCGDDQPGTCQPNDRKCTYDLQAYCGCDGVTFEAGGNCPNRRFAERGACAAAQ